MPSMQSPTVTVFDHDGTGDSLGLMKTRSLVTGALGLDADIATQREWSADDYGLLTLDTPVSVGTSFPTVNLFSFTVWGLAIEEQFVSPNLDTRQKARNYFLGSLVEPDSGNSHEIAFVLQVDPVSGYYTIGIHVAPYGDMDPLPPRYAAVELIINDWPVRVGVTIDPAQNYRWQKQKFHAVSVELPTSTSVIGGFGVVGGIANISSEGVFPSDLSSVVFDRIRLGNWGYSWQTPLGKVRYTRSA